MTPTQWIASFGLIAVSLGTASAAPPTGINQFPGKYRLAQDQRGCYDNVLITKTGKTTLSLQFSENDPNLTVAPIVLRTDSKKIYSRNPDLRTRYDGRIDGNTLVSYVDYAVDCRPRGISALWNGKDCDSSTLIDYILLRTGKSLRYLMQRADADASGEGFETTWKMDCSYEPVTSKK